MTSRVVVALGFGGTDTLVCAVGFALSCFVILTGAAIFFSRRAVERSRQHFRAMQNLAALRKTLTERTTP